MIINFKVDLADLAIEEAIDLWCCTREQLIGRDKETNICTVRTALMVAMTNVLGISKANVASKMNRNRNGSLFYHMKRHKDRMSTMHGDTDKPVDPLYYDNYNAIAERLKKL